jgi:hypothetical protein
MALGVTAVFVAITIGLFLVPGVGLLALIPLAVAVVIGAWVALTFRAGTTPRTRFGGGRGSSCSSGRPTTTRSSRLRAAAAPKWS